MPSPYQYVSFGGVSLLCTTPELEQQVNRLLTIDGRADWDGWNFASAGTTPSNLPTPPIPVTPKIKIGVLHWPNDATRPAWFYAIVDQTRLDLINEVYTGPDTPLDLILQDGREGATITAKMSMLPPRPISQLGLPDNLSSNGWLLAFTDQRFWWQWRSGSIDTAPTSWADLYAKIGLILGRDITVEAVDSAYSDPTEKWIGYLRPPATVLDAVAASVNQRIVVALDGTVRAVNWRTAKQESDDQWELNLPQSMGGYIPSAEIGKYVPASLNIAGIDGTASGPNGEIVPYTETVALADLAIMEYGDATGVSGATSTVFVDFDYTGSSDDAAWAALITQAGEDWYGWRLADLDIAFPGIVAWGPTGWEDFIEWMVKLTDPWIDEGNPHEPLISTAVRRPPFSDFPSTILPVNTGRASYIVRLVESGTGPDGGLAWSGYPQIEVDGVEVDDDALLGPDSNHFVLYPTRAADGTVGVPEVNDRVNAIPDKYKSNIWGFIPKKPLITGSDCASCGWLDDIPLTTCWRLFRRGGSGRCACFPFDNLDLDSGLPLFWDGESSTLFGDGMIGACCGCGSTQFLLNGDGTATLSLNGMHISCAGGGSGSGGAIWNATLVSDCCGTITDPDSPFYGRKFVHFTGKGPDACSGDQGPCDNTYNIIAICGFDCPEENCDCIGCLTSNPIVWTALNITGFGSDTLNGDWVLTQEAGDGCTFTATCEGVTSELSYADGSPGVWSLDHGGNLYQVNGTGNECTLGISLVRMSGSGPAMIQLIPKHANIQAVCCSGIDLRNLPDSFDVHLGSIPGCFMSGASQTVTRTAPGELHWQWVNPDIVSSPRILSVEVTCVDGVFRMGWTGCCGTPICATTNAYVTFTGNPANIIYDPLFIIWDDGVVTGDPVHAGCCPDATGIEGWIGTSGRADTWDCVTGDCVLQSDGLGQYTTLSACVDACNTATYLCVAGVCVEQTDGTGISLAECLAIPCENPVGCCGTELDAHPNLIATFRAVSVTLAWTGSFWQSTSDLVGHPVTVSCTDGVWHLTWIVADTGYTFSNAPANAQGCNNMFAIFSHTITNGIGSDTFTVTVVHP